MNSIFAFKTLGPIDVCMLCNNTSSYLQEASSITNGIYYHIPSRNNILQYLISIYLSQGKVREYINLPKTDIISLSAPCICHNQELKDDIGYVCSVCLSIYCHPIDKCDICGSDLIK